MFTIKWSFTAHSLRRPSSPTVSKFLEGMGPNVWRASLSGCLLHGNVGLAELAASKICGQDLEGYDQVVLLSNVYASVGRFQDAESLRSSLKKVV
jgi:hypothetical protein